MRTADVRVRNVRSNTNCAFGFTDVIFCPSEQPIDIIEINRVLQRTSGF